MVNNNGGPPFKTLGAITREDILAGVESNMLTPIALVQALLPRHGRAAVRADVNITSGSVRAPIAGLDVSSGARAGLTAFLASAARAYARDNVTINAILPGAFATDRQRSAIERIAASAACRSNRRGGGCGAKPRPRFGDPAEFGALCAFLASAQAGFITGQNILIDGGAFRRVLKGVEGFPRHAQGIAMKIGATFAFALMGPSSRPRRRPIRFPKIVFFRSVFAMATLAAWLASRGEWPSALRRPGRRAYRAVDRRLRRDLRRFSRAGLPAAGGRHRPHLRHAALVVPLASSCSERHTRAGAAQSVAFGFVGVLVMLSGHFGAGSGGAGSGIGVTAALVGAGASARSR